MRILLSSPLLLAQTSMQSEIKMASVNVKILFTRISLEIVKVFAFKKIHTGTKQQITVLAFQDSKKRMENVSMPMIAERIKF